MEKKVDIFVGIPCSGKSTHIKNNYDKENTVVISRDKIRYKYAEKTGFKYSELFLKPKEGEVQHELYGDITKEGNWSTLEILNDVIAEEFQSNIRKATSEVEHGKHIVIDLTNLTRLERQEAMGWFEDIDEVKFKAVVFGFRDDMDLIKEQNKLRGLSEDKFIPDFVIDKMAKSFEPIELTEGFSEIEFVEGLEGLKNDQKIKSKNRNRNRMN